MKHLEYIETLETKNFGKWHIVLQSYAEIDNKTDEEKTIYNVSIEYNIDEMSSTTLDIFENYNLKTATQYFENICKSIEQTNEPQPNT